VCLGQASLQGIAVDLPRIGHPNHWASLVHQLGRRKAVSVSTWADQEDEFSHPAVLSVVWTADALRTCLEAGYRFRGLDAQFQPTLRQS